MRLLALLTVISTFALGLPAMGADIVLRVTIPEGYDAGKAMVLVGQYGQGLALGAAKRVGKTSEFTDKMSPSTKSVKVLVYYPGCKFATTEMTRDKIQAFEPKLEKLPTIPLAITFTGSDDVPIIGQSIILRRRSVDMEYFGYMDGMILAENAPPDVSGSSKSEGKLTVQVPDIERDPLFAKLKVEPGFAIGLANSPHSGLVGFDLVPNHIKARQKYSDAVQVKVVYRGRIRGKVIPQYLANRGVEAKMGQFAGSQYHVWFEADRVGGGGGQGQGIEADGTFSMVLPAGKYDLSIQVRDDKGVVTKSIPIARAYDIGENDDKVLDIRD